MRRVFNVYWSSVFLKARDLWEFLDRPYTEFLKWFDQYKDYGFTENQDFRAISEKFLTAQGNEVDSLLRGRSPAREEYFSGRRLSQLTNLTPPPPPADNTGKDSSTSTARQ